MSQKLILARKKLNSVSSLLKQGKYMAATQAMHDSLLAVLKSSLMKAEKEEFSELITNAVTNLNNDKGLRQVYPLIINYTPGKEKQLFKDVGELLKELQAVLTENAQGQLAEVERRKQEALQYGQSLIDKAEYDKARGHFDKVVKEFRSDTDLKADIADRFLRAGRYQEAFSYLEEALNHDPNAFHLYNRIGIVLRKMKDFETAEKYYLKALELAGEDEYLQFNIGRLYIDWRQWDKVEKAAKRALELNPDFVEAEKMLRFAHKKMGL